MAAIATTLKIDGRSREARRLKADAARAEQQAAQDEAERVREESALVADLGHVPSYTERAIIEQLSALIVRGRRLRQAGQGADAEMISRLVIRGLGKLGIRQSKQKTSATPGLDYMREKAGAAR